MGAFYRWVLSADGCEAPICRKHHMGGHMPIVHHSRNLFILDIFRSRSWKLWKTMQIINWRLWRRMIWTTKTLRRSRSVWEHLCQAELKNSSRWNLFFLAALYSFSAEINSFSVEAEGQALWRRICSWVWGWHQEDGAVHQSKDLGWHDDNGQNVKIRKDETMRMEREIQTNWVAFSNQHPTEEFLLHEVVTIPFSGNGAGDNQAATSDRAAWARQKVLWQVSCQNQRKGRELFENCKCFTGQTTPLQTFYLCNSHSHLYKLVHNISYFQFVWRGRNCCHSLQQFWSEGEKSK